MHIPKKYLQDRLALFLVSVNLFLMVACIVLIAVRVLSNSGNAYIAGYRPSLGPIDSSIPGTLVDILAFIVFAIIVFISNVVLSIRAFVIQKHVSYAILLMSTVLLVLAIIISNSLLILQQ